MAHAVTAESIGDLVAGRKLFPEPRRPGRLAKRDAALKTGGVHHELGAQLAAIREGQTRAGRVARVERCRITLDVRCVDHLIQQRLERDAIDLKVGHVEARLLFGRHTVRAPKVAVRHGPFLVYTLRHELWEAKGFAQALPLRAPCAVVVGPWPGGVRVDESDGVRLTAEQSGHHMACGPAADDGDVDGHGKARCAAQPPTYPRRGRAHQSVRERREAQQRHHLPHLPPRALSDSLAPSDSLSLSVGAPRVFLVVR
eukprot:scaffold74075_cov31-Tisochrysis_lutea.AAC.4